MRLVRPVAAAVSLLLAALTGRYVYLYLDAERCWKESIFADCPEAGDYEGLITLLLVGQLVAVCASGWYVAFAAVFVGLGVPQLAIHWNDPFSKDWFGGLAFIVVPMLPLLAIPWLRRSEQRVARLMAEGSEAIGTVLSVKDGNLTVNRNPGVRIRLRIEPLDGGAPFEAEKGAIVSRVDIPRPGDRFPVFYDPTDPSDWIFATSTPDESTHPRMRSLWERAKRMTGPTLPPPVQASGDVVAGLTTLNERYLRGEIDADEYARRSAGLLGTAAG
ncbi:MAG TPA: SHOCT domain-containing protein [Mycobacteriales bacterium]|nr:SHOCT domain-containing protein [Mycobacteriales bacterium]